MGGRLRSESPADFVGMRMVAMRWNDWSPSPECAPEDLRRFQVHQSAAGAQPPVMNSTVTALRFFFRVTLDRPEMARHLTLVRQPRKLPSVLSEEEVVRLLEAANGLKYKAALSIAYGAGLRVSEVANLKVADIDSKRMLIRVEQGKGRKDRNAMLSPRLLELLRDWWWVGRPATWLFPGQDVLLPITTRQLYRAVREAAEAAEIKTRVTPHTLRHSFAMHLLEQGVDRTVAWSAGAAVRPSQMSACWGQAAHHSHRPKPRFPDWSDTDCRPIGAMGTIADIHRNRRWFQSLPKSR
jgi:integrase